MKIPGLLFERINEEFETYTVRIRRLNTEGMTKDEMAEVITEYEDRIINDSLQALYDRYSDFYKAQLNNQAVISREMEESFRYYFGFLNCVNTIYERARKFLQTQEVPDNLKFVIPHYGLLVRLADQIGVMLLNGYPDGALRIWRSFYEYAIVTLLFLKEIDNHNLQKQFISHFHRSKRKKSESYQKNHEELKFPSLDEAFISTLNEKVKEFNSTYGKEFLDNEYGWCNGTVKTKKRVTLRDIEDHVGVKRFRPFYIWASGYTHPGFESMLDFFKEEEQMIVLNEINSPTISKTSFVDPMQLTTVLFDQVNVEFLNIYAVDSEYDINMSMLRRVLESLLNTFDNLSKTE